ncbi:type II toxin-antitoxin system VapB family antitoxin [Ruania zhangjianzhongii]|uniref:type II toxin-antitoxin system VapB family antitoxin n=1 Tax=Ruania zhangjianzhongii TaxID=2603206 RepID=UPI0011C76876|nr:type II toxin-antitoxin system VapB family antitoxin [Ruania zhangjianzhongii]
MSLNIKNERVHALAREAARRTGRTQTSAIEAALERYLDELPRDDGAASRGQRLDQLLADVQTRLRSAGEPALDTEELYDRAGLPR